MGTTATTSKRALPVTLGVSDESQIALHHNLAHSLPLKDVKFTISFVNAHTKGDLKSNSFKTDTIDS